MAKQSFTFNTFFNGLSNDPSKWRTHGYYSAGIDLIGIKDLGGNINGARPGALQLSQMLARDAVSASTVVGMPAFIRSFNGSFYAFAPSLSSGSEGLIISGDSSAGLAGHPWVSAHYTSSTGAGNGGMEVLGINTLYYAQTAVLGQLSSDGTFSNNFASFSTSVAGPRPMKVFAGKLHIGNNNLISTVDSSGTFTSAALTLPVGFTVRSLEVLGDYLVIAADFSSFTRIFLWTGGTATYQESYDLPETTAPQLISREGRVFAIGASIYQLGETSYNTLFPFNYFGIPNGISLPPIGSVATWKNRILYPIVGGNGTTNADEQGGLYLLGQYDSSYPLITHQHFLLPNQQTSAANYTYSPQSLTIGAVYSNHGTSVRVAFTDNTATAVSAKYGLASIQSVFNPVESDYSYYVTLPLSMDTDSNKLFHSVRVNLTGNTGASNTKVIVYYRLNTDFTAGSNLSNWTLLGSIFTSDLKKLALPIRKMGRNIMLKFALAAHSNFGPQMLEYTVVYEALDSYR